MNERPILTAGEMRAAEASSGVPLDILMARAGAAVAEAALRLDGPIEMLVLCGPGNNGGDGYVAARLLREAGAAVRVAAEGPPRSDLARAEAEAWNGTVEAIGEAAPAPLLIDALHGTGVSRPVASAPALLRLASAARRRIALDLPSGIAGDTGAVLGEVPGFDLTVALGALKPAHRLLPGAALCGRVVLADIGLGRIASRLVEIGRPALPPPPVETDKYRRGKLVVVAGAMPGAALLAATAGQRAGAGYVELLGAEGGDRPRSLVRRAWEARALDDPRVGAVVVGPGLGRDREARLRLEATLGAGKPLVLDADALTLIGRTRHARLAGHVLTPHEGEFARLFGTRAGDRLTRARAAAAASEAVVVLKGADTIVAHPDGRAAVNPLAPAWLASAGTGDVLAGVVGALLAAGLEPFAAAKAAVWLHAGAARAAGPLLVADDLARHLPDVVASCP